ncbi:MAG TPA: type II toxin-antitoxin system prevent-host-death family antitoxin [Allosphingosinicella sp.]|jgi:prevent-host-death family protein
MPKTMIVSAAEANRSFSKLMRVVEDGTEVTVTSRGKPKIKLVPVTQDDAADREQLREAYEALKASWANQEFKVIGPWTREDLYDRNW